MGSTGWTVRQRKILIGLEVALLAIAIARYASNPLYVAGTPAAPRAGELSDRIDPNEATWPMLAALPALGEERSRQIVAYREAFVRDHPDQLAFQRPEDLAKVKGIGPVIVEQLRPFLIFPEFEP